jgi:hypothetical protein
MSSTGTPDHVAGMAHCTVTKAWITGTRAGLPNHAMAKVTFRNFEKLGAPEWSEEEKVFARELQKSLDLEPMQEPFFKGLTKLTPREGVPRATACLAAQLIGRRLSRLHLARADRATLRRPSHAASAEARISLSRMGPACDGWAPACIDPMGSKASAVIATTLIDLLSDPSLLEKARTEYRFNPLACFPLRAVIAIDATQTRHAEARRRCADLPGARFEQVFVPDEWPDGNVKLILLSESGEDVGRLVARLTRSLPRGGSVILVHWTGPTDYTLGGDEAAANPSDLCRQARGSISTVSVGCVVARLIRLGAERRANVALWISALAIRMASAIGGQTADFDPR